MNTLIQATLLAATSATCVLMARELIRTRCAGGAVVGAYGIFGLGYYVVPLVYPAHSGLLGRPQEDVVEIYSLVILYLWALYCGYILLARSAGAWSPPSIAATPNIDAILIKSRRLLFAGCGVVWVAYVGSVDLTSYQSGEGDFFTRERGAFSGVLSFMGGASLAVIAYLAVVIGHNRSASYQLALLSPVGVSVVYLLSTGQRLALITPIASVLAAYYLVGHTRRVWYTACITCVVLVLSSPLMVLLRESGASSTSASITEQYGMGVASSAEIQGPIESIARRADLVSVSVDLKKYFDQSTGQDMSQYWFSIIGAYIPRFLWPSKPYPLSYTGGIEGELSVVAWQLTFGASSIGSLSAFGAIQAYIEGGWLWVPINGALVGMLIAVIGYFTRGSGLALCALYVYLYPTIAVKQIPPSLASLLVLMSTTVIVGVFIWALDRFMPAPSNMVIDSSSRLRRD